MSITTTLVEGNIALVTMAHPPVNALPVAGWFAVAEAMREAVDLGAHVTVLRAEGKGFNAGVDIKEMQATTAFVALLGANRGCYAAFKAIYESPVPVIAAVNGFCLGGGVGLVGNCDTVIASDDAYFGVPEVNQGALGAATHMSRLVPQHMMRTLYFTARTIPATELVKFGSVLESVPRATRRSRHDRGARDRGQGHPRDPCRQGGAQRDRPGGRQQELPVRAGFTFDLNLRVSRTSVATSSSRPSPSPATDPEIAHSREDTCSMTTPRRLRTPLTELTGVEHPIVQTGMGWVAGARLVSARRTPERLASSPPRR